MSTQLSAKITTISEGIIKILKINATGITGRLMSELLSRRANVNHLYANSSFSASKSIPFILITALIIPGLFFSSFLVCLIYPTVLTLSIAMTYKHTADQISVFSRIPWVKLAIEDCAIELLEKNDGEINYNRILVEEIFVKYIVKNQNISGSEFFKIYSEICRAYKVTPFTAINIISNIKPRSDSEKIEIANKNRSELNKYIEKRRYENSDKTLEVLRTNPETEGDYKENLNAVKLAIEESPISKAPESNSTIKKRNPYGNISPLSESKQNVSNEPIYKAEKVENESVMDNAAEATSFKDATTRSEPIATERTEDTMPDIQEISEDDYEMPDYDSISDFELPPENIKNENLLDEDIDNLLGELENDNKNT